LLKPSDDKRVVTIARVMRVSLVKLTDCALGQLGTRAARVMT
jgi:hypothetical protein